MRTLAENEPLVLVMVGLPARGKTYIARKLARYLNWLGLKARVFNVGNYRRQHLGSAMPAAFFDPDNADGFAARRRMAMTALDDLLAWLRAGPSRVAIYDATNVTTERRKLLRDRLAEHELSPIFVESVSTKEALIEANVRESKLSMPDYAQMGAEDAIADFRERIANYARAYEPLTEADGSFVKLVDVGEQVHLNQIRGSLASRIVFFLMNLHIVPRPIFLMRHGESGYNLEHRVGGDASLTEQGRAFAEAAGRFLSERLKDHPTPRVWTSTLRRSMDTASGWPWPTTALKNLDEIDAGACDGWTYEQIEEHLPEHFEARKTDKLRYRYPRGESYQDVIHRLDPVIVELERQRDPVIIVAHQAVLRCLYGYLSDETPGRCPHLDMPLHTVIEMLPKAYMLNETRTTLITPEV